MDKEIDISIPKYYPVVKNNYWYMQQYNNMDESCMKIWQYSGPMEYPDCYDIQNFCNL